MTHEMKQEHGHSVLECSQQDRLERMDRMISEMHKHMFLGNGTPSWMVRLDRVEGVVKAIVTTFGAVALAGIVSLCGVGFWHIFKTTGN